jgi:enoyl-CoA hydratase
MQTHVTLEIREDIAHLIFACDEPTKPTTLDGVVLDEMIGCLDSVERGLDDLRALVVRSVSSKYFVVGANINALKTLDAVSIGPWVRRGHVVLNRLEALPLPTVAKVEGYALGGGLELAMACDFIVAAPSAKFGQPEAALGLVSGWGGSYRLPRRVGLARAKELFFTGRVIDAEAALAMGLVDYVGYVDGYLKALFGDIRKMGRLAVSEMKHLIASSPAISLGQSADEEAAASSRCLADADTQARVRSYLDSRKPKS